MDRILFQIQLKQDGFKDTFNRSSVQVLDFLGDIGGFYQALDILVFLIAQYFSAKFFVGSIASTFFYVKKNKSSMNVVPKEKNEYAQSNQKKYREDNSSSEESSSDDSSSDSGSEEAKEGGTISNKELNIRNVDNKFHDIKFSTFSLLLDPIINLIPIVWPFKICCPRLSCFVRPRILEQSADKFNQALEVGGLLKRINDAHLILKNLQSKEQKKLLKYSKQTVIDLEGESSESSGSDKSSKGDESDESDGKDRSLQLQMTKSIVKGLQLDENEKKELQNDVKNKIKEKLK